MRIERQVRGQKPTHRMYWYRIEGGHGEALQSNYQSRDKLRLPRRAADRALQAREPHGQARPRPAC